MATSPPRARIRARTDRLLTLQEAAAMVGYTPDHFRKFRPGWPGWVTEAVPFDKRRARLLVWHTDLIRWADLHDVPLDDPPDEAVS